MTHFVHSTDFLTPEPIKNIQNISLNNNKILHQNEVEKNHKELRSYGRKEKNNRTTVFKVKCQMKTFNFLTCWIFHCKVRAAFI